MSQVPLINPIPENRASALLLHVTSRPRRTVIAMWTRRIILIDRLAQAGQSW